VKYSTWLSALLVLLLLPLAAAADEDAGVQTQLLTGSETVFSGDTAPGLRPTATIGVRAPIVLGEKAVARLHARLRLIGLPGASVNVRDVETVKAADLQLGGFAQVGKLKGVSTGVGCVWGFSTIWPQAEDLQAANRYPRHYGCGVRGEKARGPWLSVVYGRHQAAGPRGWGQVIVAGEVPLKLTHDVLVLGGETVLSVGSPASAPLQRDIWRLQAAVDAFAIAELFR
jgi:hypothetical protein